MGQNDSTFWAEFLSTLPARGATDDLLPSPDFHFLFLSTLPARGATVGLVPLFGHELISIHAPREGSDDTGSLPTLPGTHFYPRSPRGERPVTVCVLPKSLEISIHAPREGSDSQRFWMKS